MNNDELNKSKKDYLAAPVPITPWRIPTRAEREDLPRVKELLSRAISTRKPYQFMILRAALLKLPPRTLAFAARDAIKSAGDSRSFDRLSKLLAEIGGDIAVATLETPAFTQ